ncbi:MAG: OsmC family protein [Candidatus Bipolaricaulota bacterium]|nr:OsmC family protein [Candidatus Bipolaricaulota bacterium]
MSMEIVFPGGKRVDALYKGFCVHTDQPEDVGGANSAPSPFDLFLASLGTCAGYYVLSFCQRRNLPTDAISLALSAVRDAGGHGIARIEIVVTLPSEFPGEVVDACARAADQCAVRGYLDASLRVEVTARRA